MNEMKPRERPPASPPFDAPQEATPRFKVVRTKWPRLVDLTRSCFRSEAENDIAPQTKLGA